MIDIIKKMKMKFASPSKRAILLKKNGLDLGENCEVFPGVKFGTEPYLIKIGDHVRITADVRFITHDGGVWVLRQLKNKENLDKFGTITIGNNVMIGTQSILMPNCSIGDNCVIGAGSVVTKSIPSNSVAVGIPAHVIGSIDNYYEKNIDKFMYTKNMGSKEKKQFLSDVYKINKMQ